MGWVQKIKPIPISYIERYVMKKYATIIIMMMAIMVITSFPVYANGGDQYNTNMVCTDNSNTATGGSATATATNGPVSNDTNLTDNSSVSNNTELNITSSDELRVTTHLQTPYHLNLGTNEYHGEFRRDHHFQEAIMLFMLNQPGDNTYTIGKNWWLFTKKSAHSRSASITNEVYEKKDKVRTFRSLAEIKNEFSEHYVIGYTDTYSKGKHSLMGCFNQAIIDTGFIGGNAFFPLTYNYSNNVTSDSTGVGGSGASGNIDGTISNIFSLSLGYMTNTVTPGTNPFLYGIVVYIPALDPK